MTRYHHVVEIGAGDSYSSEGLRLWAAHAERVTLYEPNRLLWADLIRGAVGLNNVMVHQAAVTDHYADLFHFGYASFLCGAPSFLATSVEPEGMKLWEPLAREVPLVKVDRVDWGTNEHSTIDGLILTCNGSELAVLKGLISRPKTIWTKHYLHNPAQWVIANDVWDWLKHHGYTTKVLASNQHGTFYHLEHTLGA